MTGSMDCPECGSPVPEQATRCDACGASWGAEEDERLAPVGTWSERTVPPDPMLGPEDDRRAEPAVPIPFPGRGDASEPDLTPLPGVALALVPPHPDDPDAEKDEARQMGEVVPLRPPAASPTEPGRADEAEGPPTKPRSPLLASQLLAEDLAPTHPYAGRSRLLYGALGLGGFASIALGDWSATVVVVSAFLLGIGVGSAVPLPYRTRALACLALGLGGLVASITAPGGPGLLAGLATGSTTLLGAGLFLRNAHRAAISGRLLVLVGIVAGAIWLALSSRQEPLHTIGVEWQSWAPAALKVLFFVIGLLSLLAFMDSSTHAGCAVWGGLALFWIAAHAATEVAIGLAEGSSSPLRASLLAAQAPLAGATAMALTQTLADLPRRPPMNGPAVGAGT